MIAAQSTTSPMIHRYSGEAALRDAMEAYMLTHGFTRLELTITSLRAEIAKEHRHLLALEGWVA